MNPKLSLRNFSLIIAFLLIGGFFSAMTPEFFSARNISMLVIELSITATLALGMLLVILPGHIDLSVGSGVGLIGGIASVLVFQHAWPAPAALPVALLLAVVLWSLMGRLIVHQRMPSFIITLGGLLIFKGLFWLIIQNATVPVVAGGKTNLYSALTTAYLPPPWGYALAAVLVGALFYADRRRAQRRSASALPREDGEERFLKIFVAGQLIFLFVIVMNQFRGIPLPALILGAVALAVWTLTEHTPFGRYLYAIGGNEEASIISGIAVDRTIIASFSLLGAIVAITGFMQTAYSGASTTTVGDLMELDAIAACVIGGTSLKGGRGSVFGVLSGALIMACLLNGMTLMAVSPELKYIARGAVLALAVWMDVRLSD
jgi:D-xylose transport system permease protein